MNELLPVASGLAIGVLFGLVRPRMRWLVCAVAAVLAGVTATVVSGEFRTTWEYLLVDIPLVVAAALVARLVVVRLAHRSVPATAEDRGTAR